MKSFGIFLLTVDDEKDSDKKLSICEKMEKYCKRLLRGSNSFGKKNFSLYCGKDKTLYCCDAHNDTLYGIKQDGTISFSFSSRDFRGPIGVAAMLYQSILLVPLSSVLLSLYWYL
jgi:hypothetical protein